MLRTRGLRRLYMRTDSPPSQKNQTGMGTGSPAGVTVVIQTTISSRRWRANAGPELGAFVDHARVMPWARAAGPAGGWACAGGCDWATDLT